MPEPLLRFAVLHHTGMAEPHHDLLIELEAGGTLATWRCNWPLPEESTAIRQPDHRRLYLDYEGPVSGGRGEVHRVAWGKCRLVSNAPGDICVELCGLLQLTLRLQEADRWLVLARCTAGNKPLA